MRRLQAELMNVGTPDPCSEITIMRFEGVNFRAGKTEKRETGIEP